MTLTPKGTRNYNYEDRKRCQGIATHDLQCTWHAVNGTDYCNMHQPDGLLITKEGQNPQCKAKSKRTGKRCRSRAITGAVVCRMHGAGSPFQGRPGKAYPRQKEFVAKNMPRDLHNRMDRAMNDKDLMNMQRAIALHEVRIGILLDKMPDEEASFASIAAICRGAELIDKADGNIADDKFQKGLDLIMGNYDTMQAEHDQWAEIFELMQKQSRLIAKETDRRIKIGSFLREEEAWSLITTILRIVNDVVPDKEHRIAIATRFERSFASESGKPVLTIDNRVS